MTLPNLIPYLILSFVGILALPFAAVGYLIKQCAPKLYEEAHRVDGDY